MTTKWIDKNGNVYEGDLRIGDRIASADEILNFENRNRQIPDISKRQFFQQLCILKIISENEALEAVGAALPAVILNLIDQLPEDMQFSVKMLLSGATLFNRYHPMTDMMKTLLNWSDEQLDNFFLAASKL